MLNYHGPPPENFLDEYKWNLIAGFSTAGGNQPNKRIMT